MEDSIYPKVSVLVTTYNHAGFIREALDSVLDQDYPSLDIVVTDDCSTDGTASILQGYLRTYPGRLTVISGDTNCGTTAISNLGLAACAGEYIATLDGDDLFYPEKIRRQVRLMEENPACNLSYHTVRQFEHDSGRTISLMGTGPFLLHGRDLAAGMFVPYSSAMFRRSAEPRGGFDGRLPFVSDWLFFLKTAGAGPILRLDGVFGAYRRHGHNVTEGSVLEESLRTLDIIEEELPGFQSSARKGRAHVHFCEAARLLRYGDVAGARKTLRAGIRAAPVSPRLWRWYVAACLTNGLREKLIALWNAARSLRGAS